MGFLSQAGIYLAALLPTMGMLYLFWVIMKHILEGDRRERAAQREWERHDSGADPQTGPGAGTQSDSPTH